MKPISLLVIFFPIIFSLEEISFIKSDLDNLNARLCIWKSKGAGLVVVTSLLDPKRLFSIEWMVFQRRSWDILHSQLFCLMVVDYAAGKFFPEPSVPLVAERYTIWSSPKILAWNKLFSYETQTFPPDF